MSNSASTVVPDVSSQAIVDSEKTASPSPLATSSHQEADASGQFLSGKALGFAVLGILMAIFLISLDQTIVGKPKATFPSEALTEPSPATANPVIASRFKALDQIAWITSAYFLTQVGTIMLHGQLCTLIAVKWVFLTNIVIFEIGSLFCAVAPSMNFLIFGRAFQGVGGAGLFVSSLAIMGESVRARQRSLVIGAFSGIFGIASVTGPLIGGVFSDRVTWRLCFYINLPFGVITVVAIYWFVGVTTPSSVVRGDSRVWYRRILGADWIGSGLTLATFTMLLLGLQRGGNVDPWNSGRVIGIFVAFAVLFILTMIWEWWMGEKAALPMTLLQNRTQLGVCVLVFTMMMANLIATYYLPLAFQSTRNHSAEQSGIDLLPFMISMILSAIIVGVIISKIHHYWAFLLLGPMLTAVGAGLIFTLQDSLPTNPLIGYQILYGAGVGACVNHCLAAIHQEYERKKLSHLIPQATALYTFAQFLGGDLGISIASTVFFNQLQSKLLALAPGADPKLVSSSVGYIYSLPDAERQGAVLAYSRSLSSIYIVSMACASVAALSAFAIKNYKLVDHSGVSETADRPDADKIDTGLPN